MSEIPKGIPRGWRFVLWQGGRWMIVASLAGPLLIGAIVAILTSSGVPDACLEPVSAALVIAFLYGIPVGFLAIVVAINPVGAWPSGPPPSALFVLFGVIVWLVWIILPCWYVESLVAVFTRSPVLHSYSIFALPSPQRFANTPSDFPYYLLTVLAYGVPYLLLYQYVKLTKYHFNPFWPLWVKEWREAISSKPREVAPHAS